jgi:hypothetical protein
MSGIVLTNQYTGSSPTNLAYIISSNNTSFQPRAVAVNGNYIVIGAQGFPVFISSNAGVTWYYPSNYSYFSGTTVYSISVSRTGYIMLCGAGIYLSSNGGRTFFNPTNPITGQCVGTVTDDGAKLYVANTQGYGQSNYIFQASTGNPNGWSNIFGPGSPVYNQYGYNNWNIPQSNSSLATSSDGSYVVAALWQALIFGKSNTFVNPAPAGISGFAEWQTVSISSTGQYILTSSIWNYSNYMGVYVSTNYGASFTKVFSPGVAIYYLTMEIENGKIFFAAPASGNYIYYSSDKGITWNYFYLPGSYTFTDIKYDSLTSKLFIVSANSSVVLEYSAPYGTDPAIVIEGRTVAVNGTFAAKARTTSVNVTATPTDVRTVSSVTGTTNLNEDLNTVNITMSDGQVYLVYVMVLRNCFKEGTNILCYVDNEEKYLPVQELRKGTLVKTEVNGYVAIHAIGQSKIYNSDNKLRHLNRLFRCTREKYPELTEDLIITGCHGILVDDDRITDEVKRKTKEITRDDVWLTGKKYRLLTCLDERAEPYEEEGTFPIWHFALDHFDKYMNYGIYANGLLVETCDIYNIEEHSGLELI